MLMLAHVRVRQGSEHDSPALSDAMIPQSVFYSLIPVWGYAGSPDEMRLDQGTLIFKKKCSVFPDHRVLVSN